MWLPDSPAQSDEASCAGQQLETSHINILVLALVTRRFKPDEPLRQQFDGKRIDLIKRYLRVFGASSVGLLADREFVADLIENNVPFVIRRETAETKDGRLFQFRSLAQTTQGQVVSGMERTLENLLRFEGRKIRGGALSGRHKYPCVQKCAAPLQEEVGDRVSRCQNDSTSKTPTSPTPPNLQLCSRSLRWQ